MTYSLNINRIYGILTCVSALIVLTPLCGLLFQCGCDWPWLGLDAGCNFYRTGEIHRCPWCVSLTGGILSGGLAISGGVLTAMRIRMTGAVIPQIALRTTAGLTLYTLIATLTAVIAAVVQQYPLGIGAFFIDWP